MTRTGRRLSPQRLAKLANALGVSTPVPPGARKGSDPSISTTSRFLLHVIPPSHLPHSDNTHFRRGTLVPLHSTLHAQLAAIAREYALPSTAGLVLYLGDEPGPRLSDDIWKLLWSRVVSAERCPSPQALRPLTCSPSADSPSTPSSLRSAFKSDTDPGTPDTSIHSAPALRADSLDLPGLTSPSLLPILAKVEFDIDKRKATWYHPWITRRAVKQTDSPTAPLELLTVKRSEMKKKHPLGLSPRLSDPPFDELDPEEDLDEDATATLSQPRTNTIMTSDHSDHNAPISTKEEVEVLELLEMMSRPKSRSSSQSRSSSTHSSLRSLGRKVVLPPLLINTHVKTHTNEVDTIIDTNAGDPEQSFLAYTEPEDHPDESLRQGGKREFAVFDDFQLDLDSTLDIDENDPNDRRKSQLLMSAQLDEIERTMAQLSPQVLHSDLSLSFSSSERSSLRVSPTSANGIEFLSPGVQTQDHNRSFITSSPPRLGFGRREDEGETEDTSGKSWPAIPFSMIKEQSQPPENTDPDAPPPPPRLAINGVSTIPPRFVSAPTRPPPPPLNALSGIGMTENEKRRRELEKEQGVYEIAVRRDLLPLEVDGEVIPLSPDPFGRYPSSSVTPEPVQVHASDGEREGAMETRARSGTMIGEVAEARARSGTVTTTRSRFSADSGEDPISSSALKTPTSNRTTLMSVRTIKKLWRRSKEKGAPSGGDAAPPPTPVTPLSTAFTPPPSASNDVDKSLPAIPPPLPPLRPERPSEDQLELPDISMQAALPPRLSPSPRLSPRPLNNNGGNMDNNVLVSGSGRRTPQEQLVVPPPSRPSLDQLTPPPTSSQLPHTHQQPFGSGRRTPQDQMVMHPPNASRPSLDQLAPASTPPPQQHVHQPPPGSGRRTPQDQLMFPPPPSRPSLDQLSAAPPASHPRPHPSQTQPPMQMPMFQGRNPYNGPVTPLLAMHYQKDKLDVNRLWFDQESPYPVRLGSVASGGTGSSGGGGGGGPVAVTTTPTTTASYAGASAGASANVGVGAAAPLPPPARPPSVEPEKPTASITTTMRKSILKWKLANPNANGNPNPNPNGNFNGFSDSASSSSSSSSSSGGAVPRQSFERFERPGAVGLNGQSQHGHVRGVGRGRRPSVINFGSTSSSSSISTSSTTTTTTTAMRNGGGNPQYVVSAASASSGFSDSNQPHVHFKLPVVPTVPPNANTAIPPSTQKQNPLSLSIPNPKDLQVAPSTLSPTRQSFDLQQQAQDRAHSPGSVERRSNASSFDMTQFEFVSPIPAPAYGR